MLNPQSHFFRRHRLFSTSRPEVSENHLACYPFCYAALFLLDRARLPEKIARSVISKITCGLKLWILTYASFTLNFGAAHGYISLR